jgi:hypothetical protein
MHVQLLHDIEYALAVPQPLIDINVCDPQDIIVASHWHDSAFHISQEFPSFIVHCSAQCTQNAVAGVDVSKFASRAENVTILSVQLEIGVVYIAVLLSFPRKKDKLYL